MARIGNRSSDFSLVNLLLTSQLLSEALDPKHSICYRDLLLVLIFGILALESLGNFPPAPCPLLTWTTTATTPSSTGSFVRPRATLGSVQTRRTYPLASRYASTMVFSSFLLYFTRSLSLYSIDNQYPRISCLSVRERQPCTL